MIISFLLKNNELKKYKDKILKAIDLLEKTIYFKKMKTNLNIIENQYLHQKKLN